MRIKTYLLELQYRFFIVFFNFLITLVLLYIYRLEIVYLLGYYQEEILPYFISTHLTEVFYTYIKLSCLLSLYFSFPIALLQIGLFLSPALYKYENKIVKRFLFFCFITYSICFFFTYQIFLPYCWKFFSSFQSYSNEGNISIHFEARLDAYSNFFLESLFFLQLFSQVIGFLFFFVPQWRPKFYIYNRKITYFSFLIIATFITPPDLFSQLFMTFLFILIYESFIFFLLLEKEYKQKQMKKNQLN